MIVPCLSHVPEGMKAYDNMKHPNKGSLQIQESYSAFHSRVPPCIAMDLPEGKKHDYTKHFSFPGLKSTRR